MKIYYYLFIAFLIFSSCKSKRQLNILDSSIKSKIEPSKKTIDHWYFKSYQEDSIPGISLNKLYESLPKVIEPSKITIAIIDTDIDIDHPELKGLIWKNNGEIDNNNIDDDKNGYIDDIHGWNFLRNSIGDRIIYSSYSSVRLYQKFNPVFKNKTIDQVTDTINFNLYTKAKEQIESTKKSIQKQYNYVKFLKNGYPKALKSMDSLFINHRYSLKEIDSVYYAYEKTNKVLAANAAFLYDYIKDNLDGYADILLKDTQKREEISNNIKFYDRSFIGDDENNINDIKYGSPKINGNLNILDHGTKVIGVLAANRNNNSRLQGITNNVNIMVLSVGTRIGGENDKDIALAIRYAVNNGAKIINYSASKYLPMNKNLFEDALKYAEQKDVLFVTSSGNNYFNLDSVSGYPNDNYRNTKLKNVITVSAINKKLNKNFKPRYANYGKNSVDLFAPGVKISTILPNNKYITESGTSMASSIVSGVAALILSYYPNLTTNEVKDAILRTVDKYDVKVRYQYKPALYLNFSEMSKTGGTINAYEAFLRAGEISRAKN